MKITHYGKALTLAAAVALFSCPLSAQETDWLELKEGYEDKKMGVKVRNVELPNLGDSQAGGQKVTIAIPKSKFGETETIREVVVVGKRENEDKPLKGMSYEWANDYEQDYYGLVITLERLESLPIRLYFKSDLPVKGH